MKYFLGVCIVFILLGTLIAAPATNGDIPVTTSSPEALAHFKTGLHYMDVGRFLEGRKEMLSAVEKDPGFTHAYFFWSISTLTPEEFKEALEKGTRSAEGKSEGEKILMQISQTFLDNNGAKNVELSQTLTAKYPNGPRAWMRLGFAQGGLNQHEDARKSFSKALALSPGLIGADYALAFSYLFSEPKDFNKAQQYAEECIRLEPNEAKGYELLGDIFRAKNELQKARDAYGNALAKDSSLYAAVIKKGHINSFLGNYDEARSDYRKAVSMAEPVNKIGFANFVALSYVYAGDPRTAIQELNKLVASADSSGLPKDQAKASKIATLNTAITIALDRNMLDDAKRILDQLHQAMNETIAGVADPDYARQQNANLALLDGQLAARKGDYTAARSKAQENYKAVERDDNPRKFEGYYALLGLIEMQQKNYAKAVDCYRKADLTNIYVQYQLALAEDASGASQEAKKIFRDVSRWNFNTVGFALIRKDALARAS